VEVVMEDGVESSMTDWKICIGRASKNSWAMMKGVFVASAMKSIIRTYDSRMSRQIPFGTSLISSAHTIFSSSEYLLVLWKPISFSTNGASPQRSCFWASRRDGLASTM